MYGDLSEVDTRYL